MSEQDIKMKAWIIGDVLFTVAMLIVILVDRRLAVAILLMLASGYFYNKR